MGLGKKLKKIGGDAVKFGALGVIPAIGAMAAKKKGGGAPRGLTSDSNWAGLLQSMEGGASVEDSLSSILRGFKGNATDLEQFMNRAQPFIAGAESRRLRNSDAMKYMGDQNNWDLGATAAYGAGAGMIGQQGRRATDAAMQQLSASGLGRGSARSALQQQGMQNTAGQQAQLWSQTFQQAQQNRWNSAAGLLDAHRALSQMALGQQITPRMPEESPDRLGQAMAIGQGVGGLLTGVGALAGL